MKPFPLTSDEVFRRKFIAMALGNIMEWFDFASFGALADVIGEQFFPQAATNTQLLKSLSIFGAAFLMRPVGGLLIGFVGDSIGRKRALEISIFLMIVPSFLIGILPTYHQWGWTATAMLVFLRLLQGLACGGEIVGAFIYTIEATHGIDRGFWGGCCKATGNLGSSIGLGMVAILRSTLSNHDLLLWGWRVPFLLSLLFGIVGMRLRASLSEDAAFLSTSRTNSSMHREYHSAIMTIGKSARNRPYRQPLKPTPTSSKGSNMWTYWREIVLVFFVAAYWSACYYSCFVWMMYFMSKQSLIGGQSSYSSGDETKSVVPHAWTINFCMNLSLVLMLPFGGYIGDIMGGRDRSVAQQDTAFQRVMIIGLIIGIIIFIPAFSSICNRTASGAVFGQGLVVLSIGIFGGNLPAFMVSQFDMQYRFKCVGLAYNIAHAVFSSTAPIIQTALVMSSTDHSYSEHNTIWYKLQYDGRYRPPLYLMFIATISLLALVFGAPYCKRMRDERQEMEDLMLLLDHTNSSDTQDSTLSTSSASTKRYAHIETIVTISPPAPRYRNQLEAIEENASDEDSTLVTTATAIAYPLVENSDTVFDTRQSVHV